MTEPHYEHGSVIRQKQTNKPKPKTTTTTKLKLRQQQQKTTTKTSVTSIGTYFMCYNPTQII